jgi:hypothetical protein
VFVEATVDGPVTRMVVTVVGGAVLGFKVDATVVVVIGAAVDKLVTGAFVEATVGPFVGATVGPFVVTTVEPRVVVVTAKTHLHCDLDQRPPEHSTASSLHTKSHFEKLHLLLVACGMLGSSEYGQWQHLFSQNLSKPTQWPSLNCFLHTQACALWQYSFSDVQ